MLYIFSMIMIVVSAALKNEHDELLIQRRPEHKNHGGFWEFPGGKLEPNETPEMGLRRELKEELDIDVNIHNMQSAGFITDSYGANDSYLFNNFGFSKSINPDGMILLLLYIINKWEGKISPQEGQPFTWVNRKNIYNYPMVTLDLPLIPCVWSNMLNDDFIVPSTKIYGQRRTVGQTIQV